MQAIPVVVVLGHVDHGKTTLLDAIFNTQVQQREPGGITQNIYISELDYNGKRITFVDTPGHEVFSLMRYQGGQVADVALLVIAADQGVKPQTLESLEIIQKEGIKFIVVITKIDKEGANPEKVKQQLLQHGVYLEGYGGDVPVVEVSAITKKGLDKLLETLMLYIQVENLADPQLALLRAQEKLENEALWENVEGFGVVLDSAVDKHLGRMAFCVWRYGKFSAPTQLVFSQGVARVSRIFDANKRPLKEVLPGKAFIIAGLDWLPLVGDFVFLGKDAEKIFELYKKTSLKSAQSVSLSSAEFEKIKSQQQEEVEIVPLVLKFDVRASLGSILPTISKFDGKHTKFVVVSADVGDVGISDLDVAKAFSGRVIAFRVKASAKVREYAKSHGVPLMVFKTVYELYDYLQEIREKIEEKYRPPEPIGIAKVLKIFIISKKYIVAGSKVMEGEVRRGAFAVVKRGGVPVAIYPIEDLRIFKEKVASVPKGKECGINLGKKAEIQEGDILEIFGEYPKHYAKKIEELSAQTI